MSKVYTLEIKIPPNQLAWLAKNEYKVCVAKRTNDEYNITWESLQCADIILLKWTDDYGVFWKEEFNTSSMHAEVVSKTIPIAYGQTVTIQQDGVEGPATGQPDQSGKFFGVNNSNRPLNVGISMKSSDKWQPCYVSRQQVITGGTVELIPQNQLQVWFEADSSKSGWIKSGSIEVVYLAEVDHQITYEGDVPGGGKWVTLK